MQNSKGLHRAISHTPTTQPKILEIFKGSQTSPNKQLSYDQDKNLERFVQLFAQQPISQQQMQQLAWTGIPGCIRGKVWKYLLKYISGNRSQATIVLERKRRDYMKLVATYLPDYQLDKIDCEANRKTAKIIQVDVKRTLPESKLVRNQKAQRALLRCLYIWHVKHPASGYVQGISDLAVPFFLTFLNEYMPVDLNALDQLPNLQQVDEETWVHIQSDIYWCLSKMLDAVASNYIRGFGGIKQSFKVFDDLLQQIDSDLHKYMCKKQIDLFCLTFREISTFLLRMFTPKVGIRLFDTYIACEDDYPTFTLYLLVAIMVKFSNQLQNLNFDDIMRFMQKPPTKEWTEKDLETIISEAYVYRSHYSHRFKESPQGIQQQQSQQPQRSQQN